MSDIMDMTETERLETDLRSNYSIACDEHKGKSEFKAFLISHMKTCPASTAHWKSSEMQVCAQGWQQTAPLPQAQGNSHVRTVLESPQLIHT